MITTLLSGPFLTRAEAAARCGIDPDAFAARPDVLRLPGRHLEETYFAFQFDRSGLRADVAMVVEALAPEWDHLSLADWLVRSNASLSTLSPLAWLEAGRPVRAVLDVAHRLTSHRTPTVPAEIAAALNHEAAMAPRTSRRRPMTAPAPVT